MVQRARISKVSALTLQFLVLALGACERSGEVQKVRPTTALPEAKELSSLPGSDALETLAAVESGRVAVTELSPRHLRELAGLGAESVLRRVERVWGRVSGSPTAAMQAEIQRLVAMGQEGRGSAQGGAAIFDRLCAKCHQLRGRGHPVGPPLDGSVGGDVLDLVRAVVNPNELVPRQYFATGLLLNDGQFPQGIVLRQSDHQLVLRREEGKDEEYARSEVRQMIPSGVSYMPEGLLAGLGDGEIRDLLAYLQLPAPKP